MHFLPAVMLRPYVKGYTIITIDRDWVNEVFYPTGYIEFAINISGGDVTTIINGKPIGMPKLEVLGQLTVPTRLSVSKGTLVLIASIYPHASPLFFPNPLSDFTNNSLDLCDIVAGESKDLYDKLMEIPSVEQKVQALDLFLLQKLIRNEKTQKKVNVIQQICSHIADQEDSFDMKKLSAAYGFTQRHIQKLFLNNIGLTPRSFFNMQRFNKSLELIRRDDTSLTSVAYDCGYFDQAHFIRECKKFTGLTPSEIRTNANS